MEQPEGKDMNTKQLIESIKQAEADTGNWYANRGLIDLYFDLSDALEEEYIEGITVRKPENGKLVVKCDDGTVTFAKGYGELSFNIVPKQTYTDVTLRHPSHFERTRAAVYATGNKWAIENFEATHC